MENSTKNNRVMFDTNIVLRLMENNETVKNAVARMEKDGYEFLISDMSLFELLDHLPPQKHIDFLRTLIYCKFRPIYKITNPLFDSQFQEWFINPYIEIEVMKRQLLPSFSLTLSSFLTDIAEVIIVSLANKLTKNYTSEFYLRIQNALMELRKSNIYEEIIVDSYFNNGLQLQKRLLIEYRNLVLRILTYYELLKEENDFSVKKSKKENDFSEKEFKKAYSTQDNKYSQKSFKEICTELLKEDNIQIDASSISNKLDAEFITTYIKNLLSQNMNFNINDFTDFINFKYALEKCDKYYTQDDKSLSKIKRCLPGNKNVAQFIAETRKFRSNYEET